MLKDMEHSSNGAAPAAVQVKTEDAETEGSAAAAPGQRQAPQNGTEVTSSAEAISKSAGEVAFFKRECTCCTDSIMYLSPA